LQPHLPGGKTHVPLAWPHMRHARILLHRARGTVRLHGNLCAYGRQGKTGDRHAWGRCRVPLNCAVGHCHACPPAACLPLFAVLPAAPKAGRNLNQHLTERRCRRARLDLCLPVLPSTRDSMGAALGVFTTYLNATRRHGRRALHTRTALPLVGAALPLRRRLLRLKVARSDHGRCRRSTDAFGRCAGDTGTCYAERATFLCFNARRRTPFHTTPFLATQHRPSRTLPLRRVRRLTRGRCQDARKWPHYHRCAPDGGYARRAGRSVTLPRTDAIARLPTPIPLRRTICLRTRGT